MSHECKCPSCRAKTNIADTYSLIFTLAEWPLVLLFAGCVLFYGGLAEFAAVDAFLFAFAAILPICTRIIAKKACLNCGIEFEVAAEPPLGEFES